jgi:hypothetical protein
MKRRGAFEIFKLDRKGDPAPESSVVYVGTQSE